MSERILEIEFLLNLSKQIQECRSKEVQNLVQEGVCACVCVCVGGGRGVVTSISYSYSVLTEYIYQYDVWQPHYVEFIYENDILIQK